MNDFFRGARLALPVILGYLPVGFAFGVLAVQAGLTPLAVGLMSYFVYAGSGQLIAVGLLASGTSIAGIVLTTFVVNLRHLLMSAAMTPYLRKWNKPLQAWFSFEMTDETFAANLGRFCSAGVNKGEVIGLNFFAHMGWVTGGVAGALFDSAIGDVKPLGLDFALPAMFIALLLPHVILPRRLFALCLGAALSLVFALVGVGQWNVMLATVCAATLAAFMPFPGSAGADGGSGPPSASGAGTAGASGPDAGNAQGAGSVSTSGAGNGKTLSARRAIARSVSASPLNGVDNGPASRSGDSCARRPSGQCNEYGGTAYV